MCQALFIDKAALTCYLSGGSCHSSRLALLALRAAELGSAALVPETIASPPPVTRFTYHPQPAASIPVALSVNELLFVNEYFRNGRNATQAYRTVHPKAKHTSANVSACRVLARASVKAEVERRIRYEGGITRDFLESSLLHWHARALAKDDHAAGAAILMDCAKLAGFLVEKRDVTTRDETALQPDAMVAELRRVLSPQSN